MSDVGTMMRSLLGSFRLFSVLNERLFVSARGGSVFTPTMVRSDPAVGARWRRTDLSIAAAKRPDGIAATDVGLLRLEIYGSFEAAETTWRSAENRCPCYVFQTFDWLATWHRTIGAALRVEPCIVHVADGHGRTMMLLPLGIYRRLGLSFLSFLGGIVTDYHAPIVEADFAASLDPVSVAELLSWILAQVPRADVLALERMPGSGEGMHNPLASLPRAKHVWTAHMAILGTSFEDFKRGRSAKIFTDAKRQWRRLSQIGETRLDIARTPAAIAEILDVLARQKRRRWQETGARDLFGLPGYLDFYQTLAEQFITPGLVHLSALRVGPRVVAAHLGAVFRGRFYYLVPGYEAGDWARFSVGRLLMQSLLEWSISAGLRVFDLTVGDEGYKDKWADRSLPLYDYTRGLTIRGKLFCLYRGIREQVMARAKRSERLRRLVRRLYSAA